MLRADEQELREVAGVLSGLPAGHPARIALARRRTTVQIMFLLLSHPAVLDRVRKAHDRGLQRQLQAADARSTIRAAPAPPG